MRKASNIGMLVVLFSFHSGLAQGPGQISLMRVALDEHTPKIQQLGQEIVFRVKAGVTLPNSFHVRIFRGTFTFLTRTMKAFADKDGCVPYSTALLYGTANRAIHFQPLSELGWLSRAPDGRFAPQDLVLVFEAGDQPTETSIRLHESQLDAYFKYAVPVQLLPSDDAKAAAAEVVEATQRTLGEHRIKLTQLPSGPCYNIEQLAASDKDRHDQVISEVAVVRPVSCGTLGPTAR
jgi:hypothetical protein